MEGGKAASLTNSDFLCKAANAARSVSNASAAACCFREGKPPTAAAISARVNFAAASTLTP